MTCLHAPSDHLVAFTTFYHKVHSTMRLLLSTLPEVRVNLEGYGRAEHKFHTCPISELWREHVYRLFMEEIGFVIREVRYRRVSFEYGPRIKG